MRLSQVLPRIGRSDPPGYMVAMHVFIDDSGSFAHEEFVCLAGFISTDTNWDAFYDEWTALLRKHRLPVLHTSDFLSGKAEYANLAHTFDERIAIVREFAGCARRFANAAIVVAIDSAPYRAALSDAVKKPNPKAFCFHRVLRHAHAQMREWGSTEPIDFIFDDDPKASPVFLGHWNKLKRTRVFHRNALAGIMFADDRLMPPLQAADLLACAVTREQRKGAAGWASDSPFTDLFVDPATGRAIPVQQEYWTTREIAARKDELREIIRKDPEL